ncbi:MAG TPA: CbiX/SirB N-terminal domain-containing protein [Opitutaceae bacterium]|jgi:sirohydrochlorin ferrochelatase|nr:CbiX/SirB N-terminal domain-containing protein [Opitutaceae bacterium]
MKIALIDNGSLEAAAHEGLRTAALAIGEKAQVRVEAVSWKHSNRIPPESLQRGAAHTLAPWVRAQVATGEREFIFVPFFISPQGAIGSSLRRDLEELQGDTDGFEFTFTDGLAVANALPAIVADRIRESIGSLELKRPAVVVVDHGGPSRNSADIRDQVAEAVRIGLGETIGELSAASMESPDGPEFGFNLPLLDDVLSQPGFDQGDVLIAPLFLSPGRHAGPKGDLARIARAAEKRKAGLRCHFTPLVGTHPETIETLAAALGRALRVGTHS